MYSKILPFPWIRTRDQKEKFSQSIVRPIFQATVQLDIQSSHLDNMAEADKPDPDSHLYILASVSSKLLKYVARETVHTPTQGMNPEI